MSVPLLFLSIIGFWVGMVIVAITLYDVQTIRREKALRKHPYARRWRRKLSTVVRYQDANILPNTALRDAKHQLQYQPGTRFVEVIPKQPFPRTTQQFFTIYRLFATMPFIKLRSILNVLPMSHDWPTLMRQTTTEYWRDYAYFIAAWLFAIFHSLVLCFMVYIAIIASQPLYLAAYIGLFYLWTSWSIMSHPWLTMWQKVAYLLLVPASFSYFVWRVISVPLRPLQLIRAHMLHRQMVS